MLCGRNVLVLLLHHVGVPPPEVKKRKLYLTADQLRAHVDWLKGRGYRFTTLTEALDARDEVACITFDDGFQDVVTNALPALQGTPATVFAVTSRVGDKDVVFDGDEGVTPSDLATWDELKQLQAAGWEIGSHAHRHTRKPTTDDLEASQHALEKNLGRRATALAWPYGAYDAQTIAAAKQAGFRCAATTKSGLASRDTPYQLRRVILSGFGAVTAFERLKLFGVHHGVYPLRPRPL